MWITTRKISSACNVFNLPHILCPTAFCMINILLYMYQWGLTARARPCAARTRPFGLIVTPNRALRAPPPIPASLLLIQPQKRNENCRKLCTGATIGPYIFLFILFLKSFLIFSFVNLSLFFSPSLISSYSSLLILLFLFFSCNSSCIFLPLLILLFFLISFNNINVY